MRYPLRPRARTLVCMVQPAVRISSVHAAHDAARALETPSEVRHFETTLADSSAAVRQFLATPEWTAMRERIMGDDRPPLGRPGSLGDLGRLFRWTADGAFSETVPSIDTRRAYLHAAAEVEAFGRNAARVAPVSPVVGISRPVAPQGMKPTTQLPFAEALLAAQTRDGVHITRSCWSGGSYVFVQAGYPQGIGVNENTSRATGLAQGSTAVFGPYLMRRLPGEAERFMPWTPDHEDLFATDWRILRG